MIKEKKRILITGAVLTSDENSKKIYDSITSVINKEIYEIFSPLDTMQFKSNDFER